MINAGIDTVTQALETVKQKVESYDESAQQRQVVFGQAGSPKASEESKEVAAVEEDRIARLRVVSGDLLDIWLHEGSKGLEYIKQSKAYQLTDPYVKYVDTFERVKDASQQTVKSLSTKVEELN